MKLATFEPGTSTSTWVVLHGYGSTADRALETFRPAALDEAATLLAPQGSRAAGDGFAWSFARDCEGTVAPLHEALGGRDGPVSLVGHSMGCAFGLWLLACLPQSFGFFGALAMGSAFERWELDDGGVDEAALSQAAPTTQVFLAVDRRDPAGCRPYFRANVRRLRRLGFRVDPFSPDEGSHEVTSTVLKAMTENLRRAQEKGER